MRLFCCRWKSLKKSASCPSPTGGISFLREVALENRRQDLRTSKGRRHPSAAKKESIEGGKKVGFRRVPVGGDASKKSRCAFRPSLCALAMPLLVGYRSDKTNGLQNEPQG